MKRCTVIPAHQTARAMRLSRVSFYYYPQVCFAGLYFASRKHTVRIEQPEDRF